MGCQGRGAHYNPVAGTRCLKKFHASSRNSFDRPSALIAFSFLPRSGGWHRPFENSGIRHDLN